MPLDEAAIATMLDIFEAAIRRADSVEVTNEQGHLRQFDPAKGIMVASRIGGSLVSFNVTIDGGPVPNQQLSAFSALRWPSDGSGIDWGV